MKSEVYSWRLSPDLKGALEDAARRERVSVSRLLERIAREWLKTSAPTVGGDEAEQARLRALAMQFAGTIRGGDPDRAAEVGKRVREVLARRHGR
jgi:hypothetical protein